MKRGTFKENPSVFFIGRGFIIIAILIVSSLSFTLGYFVGKSTHQSVGSQAFFIPAQQDNTEKKSILNEEKEAVVQQSGETEQSQQTLETQQSQKISQTRETQENRKTSENNSSLPLGKDEKTGFSKETKNIQEPLNVGKADKPKMVPDTKQTGRTRTYTVQAGAFKHISEAESLKAKLDEKGYKTYMIQSKTKRHQKLYKVMIGEFVTRKEADALSAKIKKSEGLKTFVRIKPEQEDLR
jgi:cell division protein FtsN